MIGVEYHLVVGDVGDGEDLGVLALLPFIARNAFELHAHFKCLGKPPAPLDTQQLFVVVAERIARIELDARGVARPLAL